MKLLAGVAFGALTFLSAAAGAQTAAAPATPASGAQAQAGATAATPTAGATVLDSTGAVLGTVRQVTPQAVVVDVNGTPAALPPTAISAGPRGLQATVSRADVLAQTQQAQGQALQQQLTAGAQVRGAGGAVVGTIKSADAQYVTVTTSKGDARLPVNGFAAGPNGPVIGLTAAQLDAAVAQAGGGASSSAEATTSGAGAASTATGTDPAAAAGAADTAGTRPDADTATTSTRVTRTTKTTKRTTDK